MKYENRYRSTFIAALWIIPIMTVVCYFTGCTTTQEQQALTLAAEIAPIVENYAATGHVSLAQSLPVFFDSLAIADPSQAVNISQFEASFKKAYAAWTGDTATGAGSAVAKYLAAIEAALPANPTGANLNTALTNAGIGASTGSNP